MEDPVWFRLHVPKTGVQLLHHTMNLKFLKAYSDEEVHGIVAILLQESNTMK